MKKLETCMNQTVTSLVQQGLLSFSQVNQLIKQNKRKLKREEKRIRAVEVKDIVHEKLTELLVEPGATVKHRSVWLRVGRSDFTRDEVLCALRSLREDKVLQNIRTSGNNFQVFWAFVAQPDSPSFSTLDDVEAPKQ